LADQNAVSESDGGFRYEIEASTNRRAWCAIAPAAATGRDAPHAHHVLARPEQARFVRIRNLHTPNDAKFSLYDLRAFGTAAVRRSGGSAQRDPADPRHARLECKALKGADFYVVRLGMHGDRSSMAAPFSKWSSGVSGTERITIPARHCLFER